MKSSYTMNKTGVSTVQIYLKKLFFVRTTWNLMVAMETLKMIDTHMTNQNFPRE